MNDVATKALIEIEKHTSECTMYRLGVNARLKRLERIIYTFMGFVVADNFELFSAIKGFAQ
jgi:hypothetical protein|tara:strand:- start:2390 stop:2572 length:183 start_codon:yes stop_codon:yes gene_type:complete